MLIAGLVSNYDLYVYMFRSLMISVLVKVWPANTYFVYVLTFFQYTKQKKVYYINIFIFHVTWRGMDII